MIMTFDGCNECEFKEYCMSPIENCDGAQIMITEYGEIAIPFTNVEINLDDDDDGEVLPF